MACFQYFKITAPLCAILHGVPERLALNHFYFNRPVWIFNHFTTFILYDDELSIYKRKEK